MKATILVLLVACGATPHAGETLVDSIRAYNDGVRWGRFEVAANHIPAKQRSQFVEDNDERGKDLKITEYDVVNVEQHNDREAKAHIKIEWYSDREGTVHETHATQTWELRGKDWMMVDEARLKGTEMPGLPEPLMADGPGAGRRGSAGEGQRGAGDAGKPGPAKALKD